QGETPPSSAPRQHEGSARAADVDPGFRLPPRVNREFFEGQLQGRIAVRMPGEPPSREESRIQWEVHAPEGPEPEGDYIADFRDRWECARFSDLPGGPVEL